LTLAILNQIHIAVMTGTDDAELGSRRNEDLTQKEGLTSSAPPESAHLAKTCQKQLFFERAEHDLTPLKNQELARMI
jgi:hypothetical protein